MRRICNKHGADMDIIPTPKSLMQMSRSKDSQKNRSNTNLNFQWWCFMLRGRDEFHPFSVGAPDIIRPRMSNRMSPSRFMNLGLTLAGDSIAFLDYIRYIGTVAT